jgi:uncharacterized protein YerC
MARVSKQPLEHTYANELIAQLAEVIGRLNAPHASAFLSEFLGPEEKLMLAKRLAAVVMIHEKHTLYAVAHTLKMSHATADTIKIRYDLGLYTETLRGLRKNKIDYGAFLDTLDLILRAGLPRYKGKENWNAINSSIAKGRK